MCPPHTGFRKFVNWGTPMGVAYNLGGLHKPINKMKRQIKDNFHSATGITKAREEAAAEAAKNKGEQAAAMKRANAAQEAARKAMVEAAKRRATYSQSPMIGALEEEKKKQKRPTVRAARRRTGAATGKQQFIIPRITPVNIGGGSGPMNV